jgi:hypothetical protein
MASRSNASLSSQANAFRCKSTIIAPSIGSWCGAPRA